MSGRCFVAGPNTWSLSSARIFFFNLKTQGRASSHSCWLMGVFSWERDCCRQGLGYLGQTGGVSTWAFWNHAQRQQMAQSLLFEVVGGSSLDRGHHGAYLAWREPQACLPHLIAQWRFGATLAPSSHARTPEQEASAVRKSCPLDHAHLRRASPGGTQDLGLPKALPWSSPSNTGPFVSRVDALHPVEILGGWV